MLGKRKAGGLSPGDPLGPAHPATRAGTAGAVSGAAPDRYTIAYSGRTCQAPRNRAELAQDALKRAWAAGLLAECCGLAGDPLGRAYWLKRRAMHLSIYYSATHPQGVTS